MTTILRTSLAWMLLVTSTQAQLFEIPSLTDGFDNLIPEWLPQCFNRVNPIAVVDCVQDQVLPSCLEGGPAAIAETFGGVAECISSSVGEEVMQFFEGLTGGDGNNPLTEVLSSRQGEDNDLSELVDGFLSEIGNFGDEAFNTASLFVNSTRACLDPLTDCVQETIQQAVDTLDPCLNASLTELVQCGQENGEVCSESCNTTQVQSQFESNPFELALTQVGTCPLIQGNLVNPFCTLVGCCEPCVPKVEALLNCVINRQLDQVPIVAGDCALTCPTAQARRLQSTPTTAITRRTQTITASSPDECLQFAPGLTGDDGEELSARSSTFWPCAYNSFAKAMEEGPPEEEESETNSEGTESSAAASLLWRLRLAVSAAAISVFALMN